MTDGTVRPDEVILEDEIRDIDDEVPLQIGQENEIVQEIDEGH
jgi:hypothetical protein